jgi:ABC-2 type transport system ATP-binding protein
MMTTSEVAIRLDGVTKVFGRGKRRVKAADDISLSVTRGQVYGFLGPNGAGKTTTIRMLLTLIYPTAGALHVLGQSPYTNRDVLKRVGAVVETPVFYNYLTGRQNLEVLARTSNTNNPGRISALLEQVNLGERARQRVASYSLGMRQRLALAAALIEDPELVIFDEPTNGMDPAGIQEMRGFIRDLVDKQGKTVFLSSHLLSEVEQVCDRVAIIHRGRLRREGSVSELLESSSRVRIEASPLDRAQVVLGEAWKLEPAEDHVLVEAGRDDVPALVRRLTENGIDVYHAAAERASLEDYFLSVTQGETV